MPTPNSNSGSTAAPAAQPPASSPAPADTPPSSPTSGSSTPAATSPPAPQTFSGTWFQEADPQILVHWTISPTPPSLSSAPSEPSSSSPSYQAQVRIYQQIFDTALPSPPFRGLVVPFSVSDPTVGPTPYLQGSLVLTQNPPALEVVNLKFPGFQTQSLTLFPIPSPSQGSGTESSNPSAIPASSGDDAAPATSSSSTSQSTSTESSEEGNSGA
jgi:hypothetical protein